MNIEPDIISKLDEKNYKKINDFITQYGNDYREANIINLFRHFFQLLEVNGLCFSSGAFVFQNDTNILFNLLTFNKLILPSNTYNCDTPKTSTQISSLVDVFATDTHRKVYDKSSNILPIKPGPCIPEAVHVIDPGLNVLRDKNMTKFEISFTDSVKNFCGFCSQKDENDEVSEPKGNCLYYPFTVKSNTYPNKNGFEYTSNLLFVKFEKFPGKAEGHGMELVKRWTGTKKNYSNFPARREDDSQSKCNYMNLYAEKDLEFYTAYSPTPEYDIQILNWYNQYVRTGCEFFVTNNLLISFLIDFLLTPVDCDIKPPTIEQLKPVDIDKIKGAEVGGKHKKRKSIKKKITKRHNTRKKTIKSKKNKRKAHK